jgi:mRNA interferase RelE/StbE
MPKSAEDESSPPYRILETRQFQRDLGRLGSAARARLESKLRAYVYPILRDHPRWGPNIKRLKNWEPATWRYRVADWRFFYEIDENRQLVLMTAADHRSEAYR